MVLATAGHVSLPRERVKVGAKLRQGQVNKTEGEGEAATFNLTEGLGRVCDPLLITDSPLRRQHDRRTTLRVL